MLTRPDRARGEADHAWPEALPDGRGVLFTVMPTTGGLDAAQVAVLDLRTGARTEVLRGGSHAHYTPSGHLIYATPGTLRAVAFDLTQLQTRGSALAVIPDVVTTPNGAVDAVVAGDGTLAYVAGGAVASAGGYAGVGGPAGTRDGNSGAAASLRASASVARWHAQRSLHRGPRVGRVALGLSPAAAHPRHVRPWY